MSVSFKALVHRPDEILPQLVGFLGVADKVFVMRACIDPALHRARKTRAGPELIAGLSLATGRKWNHSLIIPCNLAVKTLWLRFLICYTTMSQVRIWRVRSNAGRQ